MLFVYLVYDYYLPYNYVLVIMLKCSYLFDARLHKIETSKVPSHQGSPLQVKTFKVISIPSCPVPFILNFAEMVQNVLFWDLIKVILYYEFSTRRNLILHLPYTLGLTASVFHCSPTLSLFSPSCIPSHSLVCQCYSTVSYLPVLQKSKAVWVLISFSYLFC